MRPPGALAGLLVAVLAWPQGASAAAPASDLHLTFQPVLAAEEGSAWTSHAVEVLTANARAWLTAASSGRAGISDVEVRAPLSVPDTTCRELARVVATQPRDSDSTDSRTVFLGSATDCPYLGLAETPGNWVLIPSTGANPTETSRTLVHELGHTLGLHHAGSETCAILIFALASPDDCGIYEYGDRTDPLGRASLAWGLSALNLERMGWGDGIADVSGSGRHRMALAPVAAPSIDGLRVRDPRTGDVYVVSYRAPAGPSALDRDLTAQERGVYLHRLPRSDELEVGSVLLPWVSTLTRPHGGKAGYSYVAPGGGLVIRVLSLSAAHATVEIVMDDKGDLADTDGPVWGGRVTVDRRAGTLRIPQAWDQSGVAGYAIEVDGRVVARLAASADLASQTLRLPQGVDAGARITVRVTDGRGNATVTRPAGK